MAVTTHIPDGQLEKRRGALFVTGKAEAGSTAHIMAVWEAEKEGCCHEVVHSRVDLLWKYGHRHHQQSRLPVFQMILILVKLTVKSHHPRQLAETYSSLPFGFLG